MLFRNAVKASKNSNCIEFSDTSSGITPIFHRKKHTAPLVEQNVPTANNGFTPSEQKLAQQLEEKEHFEFVENVLYSINVLYSNGNTLFIDFVMVFYKLYDMFYFFVY